MRRARERGSSYLALHTTDMMATAQGMYQRMGFVRVPEFDMQVGPGMTIMAYRLDL